MGLAIAVARMSKMVLQLAISSLAIASGPSLGIFTAGLYVPFANSWVCIEIVFIIPASTYWLIFIRIKVHFKR